jgi:hypothetical protein
MTPHQRRPGTSCNPVNACNRANTCNRGNRGNRANAASSLPPHAPPQTPPTTWARACWRLFKGRRQHVQAGRKLKRRYRWDTWETDAGLPSCISVVPVMCPSRLRGPYVHVYACWTTFACTQFAPQSANTPVHLRIPPHRIWGNTQTRQSTSSGARAKG